MPQSTNVPPESDALVRFAKRVSHDINNYTTVIRTYSELLLGDVPPDSPMHADLEEVYRAADATVKYLQRITQFSRAGTMRCATIAVDDGIRDAVTIVTAELDGREVELTLDGGCIYADAHWWCTSLAELLRNAHEAAPAGTVLRVRSQQQHGTVVVDIEDAGAGIPPELLATLTEPFVTSKDGVRAAGMGLAIVSACVQKLHGDLTFARIDDTTRVRVIVPSVSATPA